MSQKFILSAEKTAKKSPFFQQQRPKRFSRKRSERDHSYQSRKSRENSICSHYIKASNDPTHITINLTHDDSFPFMDEPLKQQLKGAESERRTRKTMLSRTNGTTRDPTREECTLTLRIKLLETQMKAKQEECQRFRLQAEEQRDRRRRAQSDRKIAQKESASLQRQNEELLTQTKKLIKEKQILGKQIQFLERINYDEKTRNIQSFREKHLQEELFRLREKLMGQKQGPEIMFQAQLEKIRRQKQAAEEKFRSMQSLVSVLKRKNSDYRAQILQERSLSKERILRSEEYRELRERYKRFIDQYKQLKNQNGSLKKLVEEKEADFELSEQEDIRL